MALMVRRHKPCPALWASMLLQPAHVCECAFDVKNELFSASGWRQRPKDPLKILKAAQTSTRCSVVMFGAGFANMQVEQNESQPHACRPMLGHQCTLANFKSAPRAKG